MAQVLVALDTPHLLFVLILGILPALLWLWFWLKEDYKRPEPRGLLLLAFFAGALSVVFVIPAEKLAAEFLGSGLALITVWALIEELFKFAAAYGAAFWRKAFDEPVDAMVYLLTTALGFAAFENVLFVIKSIGEGGLELGFSTAAMRFIGATLLHVLASASLGGILALAFCKSDREKNLYAIYGLVVATILHTLFNFFIINVPTFGGTSGVLLVFVVLWIAVVGLLYFFEKIKRVVCITKV